MIATTTHLHAVAVHRGDGHVVLLAVVLGLLVVLGVIAIGVGHESLRRALGNALDD